MGCDIHLYKEKRVNGKWVAADEWTEFNHGDDDKGIEVKWQNRFTGRNYELFGILSKGVRTSNAVSFEPRGIPFDVCWQIQSTVNSYGQDGHSHNYLYLHELKDLYQYLESFKIHIKGMKDKKELAVLKKSIKSDHPNWKLLFPYCKWTTCKDHEEFAFDVPATFYVGECLKKIIESFNEIDGENHRIVFFFDN